MTFKESIPMDLIFYASQFRYRSVFYTGFKENKRREKREGGQKGFNFYFFRKSFVKDGNRN